MLASSTVVLSETYKRELKSFFLFLFPSSKVSVIPNGIDVVHDSRAESSELLSHRQIRIGMAARFSGSKRQDLIIDATEDLDVQVILAGTGETLSRNISRAEKQNRLVPVVFTGMLSQSELTNWFADLDIYVHCTDGETLSTSVLQAMSHSLPLIASDISGMSEIFSSQPCGAILVPNTVKAWYDTLVYVCANPDLHARMGKVNSTIVSSTYSIHSMIKSYGRIFDSLIR